jgi:hypothetical protein
VNQSEEQGEQARKTGKDGGTGSEQPKESVCINTGVEVHTPRRNEASSSHVGIPNTLDQTRIEEVHPTTRVGERGIPVGQVPNVVRADEKSKALPLTWQEWRIRELDRGYASSPNMSEFTNFTEFHLTRNNWWSQGMNKGAGEQSLPGHGEPAQANSLGFSGGEEGSLGIQLEHYD